MTLFGEKVLISNRCISDSMTTSSKNLGRTLLGKNEVLLVLPNQLNEESGFRSYVIHWMRNYSLNGIRGYYFHKEHTSLYRDLVSKQLGNMVGFVFKSSLQ